MIKMQEPSKKNAMNLFEKCDLFLEKRERTFYTFKENSCFLEGVILVNALFLWEALS